MAGLTLIFGYGFEIAHPGQLHWVPVHHAGVTINQPFVVQVLKSLQHRMVEVIVHGKCLAPPIHRDAQFLALIGDHPVRVFFPSPDFLNEIAATHLAAVFALFGQLLLHHGLGGDAGVIGARHPQRARPFHAVVARHQVLGRRSQGVPHVQCAGHVRWRDGDDKLFFIWVQINLVLRLEIAACLPEFIDASFHIFGVICF